MSAVVRCKAPECESLITAEHLFCRDCRLALPNAMLSRLMRLAGHGWNMANSDHYKALAVEAIEIIREARKRERAARWTAKGAG